MPIAPQVTNTPIDITSADFAITAVSYTSSTATYTASGHTFSAGDTVIVSGIVPAGYSGTFTISSVVAGTSFTCANTTNLAVTTATGDAFTANNTDFAYADVQQVYQADIIDVNVATSAAASAAAAAAAAQADATTAIANANTAITNAAAANAAATSAAYAAGVAQTTANGKNTAHYSTSGPSGSGTNGDIWFQVNGGGTVLYQYVYSGGSWVSAPISNTVIANLDAGKINAGTITGIAYNNGSGTFSVSPSGVLVASSATITGNITATSGTFTGTVYASAGTFTGTVTATSGSFTGSIYASAGNIGGFNIVSNDYLNYGTTYLYGNSGYSSYALVDISRSIYVDGLVISGSLSTSISSSSGGIRMGGTAHFGGNLEVVSMSSGAYTTVVYNSSNNRFYTSSSTRRVKDNITPLVDADYLSAVLALKPVTFTYKPEFSDDQRVISGLIAEDVFEIEPFKPTVNLDKNGLPESIAYDRLAMFFIPALKQLNDRLAKLEGK
jgi:hypothetical protein